MCYDNRLSLKATPQSISRPSPWWSFFDAVSVEWHTSTVIAPMTSRLRSSRTGLSTSYSRRYTNHELHGPVSDQRATYSVSSIVSDDQQQSLHGRPRRARLICIRSDVSFLATIPGVRRTALGRLLLNDDKECLQAFKLRVADSHLRDSSILSGP